jgi:hypothetical protein
MRKRVMMSNTRQGEMPRVAAAVRVGRQDRGVALSPGRTPSPGAFKSAPLASPDSRLSLSRPFDPAEREADRFAGWVMRTTSAKAVGSHGAQPQQTQAPRGGMPITTGLADRIRASRAGGEGLDAESRAFMEPRFGVDFSRIRIHADNEAARMSTALHADAFTVGSHIYFNAGQLDPATVPGRMLLSHELAHALQAGNDARVIQRKIKVKPGVDLSSLSDGKDGDVYTYPEPIRNKGLDLEILTSMLHSPRLFNLQGETTESAKRALASHVIAREGVVAFAKNKKYRFVPGEEGFEMNPKYWTWGNKKFKSKPGVDLNEARADLNVHPELYAIGCAAATQLTVKGGAQSESVSSTTGEPRDWIPGESGFIENPGWNGLDNGLQGENIIYMGAKRFWGHFANEVSIKPYKEWYDLVDGWDDSTEPVLSSDRTYPVKGLLE